MIQKPLKIGMISLYLPSENKIGSGYQAHYMANAFLRRGHCVTLFSPSSKPDDALYSHVQVDPGPNLRTFRFAWRLRGVDWSQFDVLHAHGDDYWLWTRRQPVHVRTMHGSCLAESLHVPGIKEKFRMFMLGMSEVLATFAADATVCVSANTCRSYPWVRRVIVNGVDTSAFRPLRQGELRETDPTILFVGTYQNRKRGKLLMDAFESVIRPALPSARLWMVCSDAPAAPNVETLGRLSTPDLTERYRRAWAFCLPSSYEGFGVPYIEAMACGTPVVATPNPGSREVLDEGKYGMIVSPEQLGSALLALLQSAEKREELRVAGLMRAQQYAWDTVAIQYETLYEDLRSPRAHGSRPAAGGPPAQAAAEVAPECRVGQGGGGFR